MIETVKYFVYSDPLIVLYMYSGVARIQWIGRIDWSYVKTTENLWRRKLCIPFSVYDSQTNSPRRKPFLTP